MYILVNINTGFVIFSVTADHLKLLLSFAVGGLLGDVFLHLLPEAWAHVHDGNICHLSILYFIITAEIPACSLANFHCQ